MNWVSVAMWHKVNQKERLQWEILVLEEKEEDPNYDGSI